jgi:hypothetical protein
MKHTIFSFLSVLVVLLMSAACSFPNPSGQPTLNPTLSAMLSAVPPTQGTSTNVPTVLAVTETPGSASSTAAPATNTPVPATAVPPTAVPPTKTPAAPTPVPPTSIPISGATRINFAAGATSVGLNGTIAAHGAQQYVLGAGANQVMMINTVSPNGVVSISVIGVKTGQVMIAASAGVSFWQGRLPASQDYLIRLLNNSGGSANFGLSVTIPQNVFFNPGATLTTLNGSIISHQTNTYLARAFAGQTMTVKITSPASDVLLTIYGYTDGQPLVRYVSGATSFTGVLPLTQDYVIQAVSVGNNTNYTISITIK